MGTSLSGYLVLQGDIPFRTAQFKQLQKLCPRHHRVVRGRLEDQLVDPADELQSAGVQDDVLRHAHDYVYHYHYHYY